jgi:hypothetical protein
MLNTDAIGSVMAYFKAQYLSGEIKKDYEIKYSWPDFVSQSNSWPSSYETIHSQVRFDSELI